MFLVQGEEAAEGGSLLFPLLMIVGLFAIFYFLLIRPQRKRRDQQSRLQSSLAVGDEVVTVGGLYGTIAEIDDQTIILETSEGVYSRYARGSISQKVTQGTEAAEPEAIDAEDTTSEDSTSDADRADPEPSGTKPVERRDNKD